MSEPMPAVPLEIRRIEANEISHLVRMWRAARESSMAALEDRLGHTPEDDLEFFSNVILVERDVWVAVKEGAVVGFLALEGECLENLYVDPTSQNQGVGHALLEFAQQRSPARLELWTFVANKGSRRFYERHGFKAIQFSTSSPPENEPDVQYRWTPASSPPPR